MRAFTLDGFETQPALRDDLAEPRPGSGELLVRVRASSVNPADVAIAAGLLKGIAEYEFPVTLGRDFAGVVERVGDGVTGYRAGDEVFGFLLHANPEVHDGMSQPTPENLQRLAELLETGRLRVPIQRTYELAQAGEAMKALAGSHTQGKLAIIVE